MIFFFKTDNFLPLDAGDKINAVLNRGFGMPYTPPGGRWVVYLTSPCSSSPETEAYSIPWRALRCDAVTEEGGSSMPCSPLGGSWVKPVVEPREDLSGMRNWVQPRPLPWGLAWLSWGQMLNTLTDTSPGWLERQTGGRWLHLQGMCRWCQDW